MSTLVYNANGVPNSEPSKRRVSAQFRSVLVSIQNAEALSLPFQYDSP